MIQPHPSAPVGLVSHLASYDRDRFFPPCAILCRNTSPLVSFAYELLHRNVPCRVVGKDLGWALCKIVDKLKANDMLDFTTQLTYWYRGELNRCVNDGKSPERVEDQFKALQAFAANCQLISDLKPAISAMFTDATSDSTKVLLLTIHRSKGLEWPTVFLLDFPKLLPSKYATQQWQLTQERNLAYVAVTRSMSKLFYINSDNWKPLP